MAQFLFLLVPIKSLHKEAMFLSIGLNISCVNGFTGEGWTGLSYSPILFLTIVLVICTRLEDKVLQNELGGYPEYAKRVLYRLLPGVMGPNINNSTFYKESFFRADRFSLGLLPTILPPAGLGDFTVTSSPALSPPTVPS